MADKARLDIVADNFWRNNRRKTFFFNSFAASHRNFSLNQCYRQAAQEKRRAYDDRVGEVEHGCFTPLVLSTASSLWPAVNMACKVDC